MNDRCLFTGYALHAVDAKGRVSLPAPFRREIDVKAHESFFYLGKRKTTQCLFGYDSLRNIQLSERSISDETRLRESNLPYDRETLDRATFASVEPVSFDTTGRFGIPPFLRAKLGLKEWALFLGAGLEFEIWNPHTLLTTDNIDEDIKDYARYLLGEKGVTL